MPKIDITSPERRALRAAAHPLRPVVLIGDRGLTESVLKEIDLNLKAHQLIKVRVAGDDRQARVDMLETICEELSCAEVHHLGKTLIIYRPDPDAQAPILAAPKEAPTRAVRKPSEPYTPKKMAATGQAITRRDEKARKALARKTAGDDGGLESRSPRERAAARHAAAARGAAAPRIPRRRSGSALSLRAGSRRGRD
ncbi:YhbY family RNA-binding protein [Achromobacter sp. F4_2707]|uniref:YhbY family RNA-binding protein n=1 Tax=Achromobacter sp. F4_2707 TaxID=3114286 RepID=UPI0039C64F1B